MRTSNLKLISVFLISIVLIAYELSVMRSFAVGSWATFGSMVISIALLGFGLAGTILTFLQKRLQDKAEQWLSFFAVLLPVMMAIGHVVAQQIPFNPKFIASDPAQWWWIGAYFVVYALPFLCGAFYIGIAFIALSNRIHQLYFWNMLGSGIGGFLILVCMYLLPSSLLTIPLFVLAGVGSIFCFLKWDEGKKRMTLKVSALAVNGLSLAVSILLIAFLGAINVSPEKSISIFQKFPKYTTVTQFGRVVRDSVPISSFKKFLSSEVYQSYSPLGEIDLFQSSFFHSAPGLSENFSADENNQRIMPDNAFMGLYVDGSGPIQFMRKLNPAEQAFIDYLPMAAPYALPALKKDAHVFLIRSGGGIGTFTALHYNAAKVTIVEPNSEMINLLSNVPVVTKFNGDLLKDPRISLLKEEPRAFAKLTSERFGLVEISLIDSVGLNDDGGYSVVENFTYTIEGISDYMRALGDNGILSITVWDKLSPPRNVLRLITTVYDSLLAQGVPEPGKRIFFFNDLLKTATILVKNQADFTDSEIKTLEDFCRTRSFEVCYRPGISPRQKDFDKILAVYKKEMFEDQDSLSKNLAADVADPQTGLLELLKKTNAEKKEKVETLAPGDLYHFALLWLSSGREHELYDKYVFDIRPATDNRPYYTAYLKPETVGIFLGQTRKVASEWGYILLIGTLLQSLIFGALIILIPLLGRRKELFQKRKGTFGVIAYFACLGLGYMLVEIFLIQKLTFFLADPIFSTSIVITAMLVISGLGSLFASRVSAKRTLRIRIAAIGVAASLAFYIFLLSPILGACLGLPFAVKTIIAIILIAPSAFFMGMPFPTGLDALSEKRKGLLPWAWGMNGALSVTGAAVARLLSVSFGFIPVLLAAIALYVIVGIIYPANEAGEA